MIPALGQAIDQLDVPLPVKQALTQGLALGIGSATGGMAGAAAAQNATSQNYLTPRENLKRNQAMAECRVNPGSAACTTANQLNELDKQRDTALAQAANACNSGSSQACLDITRTLNQFEAKGKAERQQLVQQNTSQCGPPRDCASASNWVSNELRTLHQFKELTWTANASGAVQQTVGPEAALAGGALAALRLSAAGFAIGAGFDAAGQYTLSRIESGTGSTKVERLLTGTGTVRPEQSMVAGLTAAYTLPLAARGNLWVPAAGATASALNTAFNNMYYQEKTNVWLAAGLGGAFGVLGPALGLRTEAWLGPFITNAPRIPISGSAYIPIQGTRLPNLPGVVGGTVTNTLSNVPSFISLDNGKAPKKD